MENIFNVEEVKEQLESLNGTELIETIHTLCDLYKDDPIFTERLVDAMHIAKYGDEE